MSSSTQAPSRMGVPQWKWNARLGGYYYIDHNCGECVIQDGRRLKLHDLAVRQALASEMAESTTIPVPVSIARREGLQATRSRDPTATSATTTARISSPESPKTLNVQTTRRQIVQANSSQVHTFSPSSVILPATPEILSTGHPGQGSNQLLSTEFQLKPPKFFEVGRVFSCLWVEPLGSSSSSSPSGSPAVSVTRFGELAYSRIRRFVIVRTGPTYCSVIPISTYNNRGVAGVGTIKSEHSIVYTSNKVPPVQLDEAPRRGEHPMLPLPIHVIPLRPGLSLHPCARLNYGRIYTVEHNLKVQPFGHVLEGHMQALHYQFRMVWEGRTMSSTAVITGTEPAITAVNKTSQTSTDRPTQSNTNVEPSTAKIATADVTHATRLPAGMDSDHKIAWLAMLAWAPNLDQHTLERIVHAKYPAERKFAAFSMKHETTNDNNRELAKEALLRIGYDPEQASTVLR